MLLFSPSKPPHLILMAQWLRLSNAGGLTIPGQGTINRSHTLHKTNFANLPDLSSPAFTHPTQSFIQYLIYLIYSAYCPVNHSFPIYQLCLSFICEMGVIIIPTSKVCG